jgi:hypothetical protein
MTANELNEYIFHYLKKDKTRTAIMLTGEWGSGKTYYIENKLVPFLKEQKATCVVVSLYGLEDTYAISKSIYIELRMHILAGKATERLTSGRIIAKSIFKNIASMAKIDLDFDKKDLKQLYESVDLKDKLLIFEDIERSNIAVTELLGYVNGLVERDGVKVLLVANENEILKKQPAKLGFNTDVFKKKPKSEDERTEVTEDIKTYLHIKEKTISDTIQFVGDTTKAIEEIIKDYQNELLNRIINKDIVEKLSATVNEIYNKNLRTFIFAIQKMVDITGKMNTLEYEDNFFICLMFGIIYLSESIKTGEFPKWEGTEYLSTKLGSIDAPLMRFAYDYIRWKTFDIETVKQTYEAYKDFKLFDEYSGYKDEDMKVLNNYDIESEENVLNAFKNIEQKLQQPDAIGIYAYPKLANYLICVGDIVGFDSEKSCKLMIKNAKEIGKRKSISADFFLWRHDIEDDKLKEKYENFIRELCEAFNVGNENFGFLYNPDSIEDLYTDICRNTYKYTSGHRFMSKYSQNKIFDMLLNCSAAQLQNFRGILFAVYRNAGKNEYDENDIESMKELLVLLKNAKMGNHRWDKIQLLQIEYLCMNLEQFIKQMS